MEQFSVSVSFQNDTEDVMWPTSAEIFKGGANKIKVVNNKVAISGPTHPEFEDVPIPLYLPFGISTCKRK